MTLGIVASAHVEAAGGWTPASIAGLQVWYDASDTSSITHSSGAVSQWNDKSSNARHITQATSGNRPTTGTNTINGLNVIRFDGTNDALATAGAVQIVNSSTGEWSGFVVVKPTAITPIRCIVAQDGSTRVFQMRCNNTPVNTMTFNTVGSNFQDSEGSFVADTATQMTSIRTGTTVETRKDGATNGAAATTGTPRTDSFAMSVGHQNAASPSSFWQGDLAEIIIYNVAIGSTDQTTVQSYLKTKWATP